MKGHRGHIAVAAVVGAVAILFATGVLPDLPDAKDVIEDVARALGPWTYALVGALAFLETGAFVGLVAPGETTVIVGGVIAGQGEIDVVPLLGLVWFCCVLGDSTSFLIGRRLGRQFLVRHGPKIRIDEDRLEQVESLFQRHGGKTILIGRFIGLVRALAPFVAGASGLPYRRFIPYSAVGSGLWAALFTLLGYLFYRSFDQVAAIAGKATFAFGLTVGVAVAGTIAYRRLRQAENRRRAARWMERTPVVGAVWRGALRPLGRFAGPRLRFVWQRLTPGELGLELTTVLAIAGVGAYVYGLYATIITGGRSRTPADTELLDMADSLRDPTAVDIVEVLTGLGAFPTVGMLVLVVGIVLMARGHATEAIALVCGAALVYLGVQVEKAGVDRPRPPMPLADAEGSSYPSGHAAYSTLWVGAAVALTRAFHGLVRRAALVGAGIGVAAVVGLTRIYLRVHYWSDVAGGWALGAFVLGAVAAVALIVTYVRQTGEAQAASRASS